MATTYCFSPTGLDFITTGNVTITVLEGSSSLEVIVVVSADNSDAFCTLSGVNPARKKRAVFSIDQEVLLEALSDPLV